MKRNFTSAIGSFRLFADVLDLNAIYPKIVLRQQSIIQSFWKKPWLLSNWLRWCGCIFWVDWWLDPSTTVANWKSVTDGLVPSTLISDCDGGQWSFKGKVTSPSFLNDTLSIAKRCSCYCYLARENFHGPFPHEYEVWGPRTDAHLAPLKTGYYRVKNVHRTSFHSHICCFEPHLSAFLNTKQKS